MNAPITRNARSFVAAVTTLALQPAAVRSTSTRDLAVMEGILQVILESVSAELERRDVARAAAKGDDAAKVEEGAPVTS